MSDNNSPAQEIEVKFFDIDLNAIRSTLKSNNATLETPERLMKRAVFGGELNPLMRCTYGRVRDEGMGKVTVSAKYSAVAGQIESQKERMIVVDNFDEAVNIILDMGVKQSDYQENKRETWDLNGVTVELETWPDLPNYIEIEGGSVEELQNCAQTLGLDWEAHTTDSTDKLYESHFKLSADQVREKLSNLRFS